MAARRGARRNEIPFAIERRHRLDIDLTGDRIGVLVWRQRLGKHNGADQG